MKNGAAPTLKSLRALQKSHPDQVEDILDYLEECPLYETVHVNKRDFVLTHGGLGNFSGSKKLSDYTADELLWTRPDLEERYFTDRLTIIGHTPTGYYGSAYKNKILYTPTWIDIDTGSFPCILRLDDLAEFYTE